MADYCVYWFRLAHDHLPECTKEDPLAGRAGLVGTQNIRNNKSRDGGLDHVVKTGTIVEAVDNQPWSGEANVHVSIVNWVKTQKTKLLPKKRRLWQKVDAPKGREKTRRQGAVPAHKDYELEYRDVPHINSALSDKADVSNKRSLSCNKLPKRCYQGKIPGYPGFLLDAEGLKRVAPGGSAVVFPYLTGRELLDEFQVVRWSVDFEGRNQFDSAAFSSEFAHVRVHVPPDVQARYAAAVECQSDMVKPRKEHLDRSWQFWNRRDALTQNLKRMKRVICCSRVTRRPIVVFLSTEFCPSDLIQVFALDDDYSYGVLQSRLHFEWFRTSSRMKVETDTRYSERAVFNTFPWPQSPTKRQIDAVAEAGREVRRVRTDALTKIKGGLRAVYRTLELPGRNPLKDAHAALDAAVLKAYGFDAKGDVLAQLLELNLEVADLLDRKRIVVAPGIPPDYPNPAALVTDDCIRPAS
ncbi:MAG: hypothetical protein IID33_07870 [Planctomycetes bacterium]|nr:hypothetical protein [Planctomycetota bacterium]